MSVSRSALDYLLIESVPLCNEVTTKLGLGDNIAAETNYRQEKHGFNVGVGLAHVVTRDYDQYLNEELDIVKFVCKDLWAILFSKQIDGLKTNHRDTYFLLDNNFPLCHRMSTNLSPEETAAMAEPFLWFPAGLIRGFLHGMGIECRVDFDSSELPKIQFIVFTIEK